MQITRASEYGVLGLLALARRPLGDVVMLETIAAEEDIPVSFLGKIFQGLARAGLVKSSRGSGGGFALVREPATISALVVIEAVVVKKKEEKAAVVIEGVVEIEVVAVNCTLAPAQIVLLAAEEIKLMLGV